MSCDNCNSLMPCIGCIHGDYVDSLIKTKVRQESLPDQLACRNCRHMIAPSCTPDSKCSGCGKQVNDANRIIRRHVRTETRSFNGGHAHGGGLLCDEACYQTVTKQVPIWEWLELDGATSLGVKSGTVVVEIPARVLRLAVCQTKDYCYLPKDHLGGCYDKPFNMECGRYNEKYRSCSCMGNCRYLNPLQ